MCVDGRPRFPSWQWLLERTRLTRDGKTWQERANGFGPVADRLHSGQITPEAHVVSKCPPHEKGRRAHASTPASLQVE